MNQHSLGVIGPGSHFKNKIEPVIKKNKFFKINGYLRKKKIKKKNFFSEKEFFRNKFDFVYISCPSQLHEKYIIKSLNSGYNVICEKPFVTSLKNLKKIISLSKKKNKLIFECFMYAYHPVFDYVKKLIKKKKLGPIEYVISNFRYPSLKKDDDKYSKNIGNGFYYDSAVYPISLENYLFEFKNKPNVIKKVFKRNVDLRGYIILKNNLIKRFYFWGEGQNYSNNLEIFFKEGTIYIDKFFSKLKDEKIYLKINTSKKKYIKKFKDHDHFELMFKEIIKNYKSRNFLQKCRNLIYDHSHLVDFIKSF